MKNRRSTIAMSASEYRSVYLYLVHNLSMSAEDKALEQCLQLVVDLLTPSEVEDLLLKLQGRLGDASDVDGVFERADDLADILIEVFLREVRPRAVARSQAVRYVLDFLGAANCPRPEVQKNPFLKRVAAQLGLSRVQQECLYYLAVTGHTNRLSWMQINSHAPADFAGVFSSLTQIPAAELMKLASPASVLCKTGLVEENGDRICISDEAARAIRGEITVEEFQQTYFLTDSNPAYAIDTFDVEAVDCEIMTRMLTAPGPCMILLYGKPGSGKTELARALAKDAGKNLLAVYPRVEGSHQNRLARVQYTTFFADSDIVLVDEADNILNTGHQLFGHRDSTTPSKSLLNTFIDQCPAKIIWITNDVDDIHESTLRRFHFKKRFDKLSLKQREQAMDLILQKHNHEALKDQKFVQDAIKDEFITPGILDNVMQSFVRIASVDSGVEPEAVIPRLLQSHRPEKKEESGLSAGDETYRLEILNTSGKPQMLIDTAKTFFANERRPGAGLNLLLHGLPGTGKTEFVKYLARQCGRDVLFRRGSDLLSKWLGETEQNIAKAFREAERSNAILLVDEADTFFQPREQAQRSWEVSQTNEFLNQMENHSVLLFCCTNLISRLDAASMRRFHFKLEFRAMVKDTRAAFFADYFKTLLTDLPPLPELDRALRRLATLTPGDFRAVRQRYSYCAPGSVTWQELVSELEAEGGYRQDSRSQRIGF